MTVILNPSSTGCSRAIESVGYMCVVNEGTIVNEAKGVKGV